MLRKLVAAIIGVSALVPSTVFGLGMGEVELDSYLNQPLDARIELMQTRGMSSAEIIANLASVSDFAAAGVDRSFFLSQLKFEVLQGSDGKSYLKVSSDRPVTEPYLNFLIEVQWPAGRLLREYTLLLDPPEFKDELPLAVRAAESSAAKKSSNLAKPAPQTGVAVDDSPAPAASSSMTEASKPTSTPARSEEQAAEKTVSSEPKSAEPKPTKVTAPSAPVLGSTVQTYTVKSSDTLSDIVKKTQSNSDIPLPQALIAYQYMNPDAFIDKNMNLIRKGAVLNIPSEADIRNISRTEAIKEIAAQNKAWRAKVLARQQASQNTELGGRQLDGTGRDLTPDQKPKSGEDGRLSILVPGSDESNSEKAVSGQGAKQESENTAAISKLQNDLAFQQEEIEKFNVANEGLNSEIKELNSIIDKTDRVISLKDDQIASLQAQLKLLQDQENAPEQAQGTTPGLSGDETSNDEASDAADLDEMFGMPDSPQASENANSGMDENIPEFDTAIAEDKPSTPIWTNPLYLGGAGALLLAILGLLWMRSRQSEEDEDDDDEEYEYVSDDDDDEDDAVANSSAVEADKHEFSTEFLDRQLLEAENDFDIDTVLSEADIYVAYGHFHKAIGILQNGLNESPNSIALNMKLLEVHAENKDADSFQQVETQIRNLTSDDAVLSRINGLRQTLGLAAGAGPAAVAESFDEEETQFMSEATSTDGLVNSDTEEDFLSLADIEAELDVGHGFNEKAPAQFDEELTADSRFVAEETQVNESADFEEELDLSGGALDFNFEETSVPEDGFDLAKSSDEFSPDDALADIDQEIGSFNEDEAAYDEKEELSSEFGELDLDALESEDPLTKPLMAGDTASLDAEVDTEADAQDLTELGNNFDTEAVQLDAEEELDLDADFSLDEDTVESTNFAGSNSLSGEDASLLDGVDEVGTKLDLATAYIDMGDHEGAKDILDEVLLEGTEDQQQLARELLEKVG